MPDGSNGSLAGFAQQRLERGEDLLDRVQIGTVGRQEEQMGAGLPDRPSNRHAFVTAEIVEYDNIAWTQPWHQELRHPGEEQTTVDQSVEDAGCDNSIRPQPGHKGHGFLVPMRHRRDQALAPSCAAVGAGHVGLGPGLIDKDQARGVNPALMTFPAFALVGDIGPIRLGGA